MQVLALAPMLERLLWLLVAVLLCGGAWGIWRVWQARRLAALQARPAPSLLDDVAPSGPALLYFSTGDCAQCRFQQAPILQRLVATAPVPVPVVALDAVEREDLARHFGILTVPSTVLLDGAQRPVAINHGLAPLHKLQQQLATL